MRSSCPESRNLIKRELAALRRVAAFFKSKADRAKQVSTGPACVHSSYGRHSQRLADCLKIDHPLRILDDSRMINSVSSTTR